MINYSTKLQMFINQYVCRYIFYYPYHDNINFAKEEIQRVSLSRRVIFKILKLPFEHILLQNQANEPRIKKKPFELIAIGLNNFNSPLPHPIKLSGSRALM